MKSWEKYYQEFISKLSPSNHLIISFLDNDESIKIITQLGYKFDPQGKTLKDCKVGSYYFWHTAFEFRLPWYSISITLESRFTSVSQL